MPNKCETEMFLGNEPETFSKHLHPPYFLLPYTLFWISSKQPFEEIHRKEKVITCYNQSSKTITLHFCVEFHTEYFQFSRTNFFNSRSLSRSFSLYHTVFVSFWILSLVSFKLRSFSKSTYLCLNVIIFKPMNMNISESQH